METVLLGARCWCWLPSGKKHYGVCTGIGPDGALWFVHNTRDGGVVHSTRKGFAGNRKIYVEWRPDSRRAARAVAERARSLVGAKYDILSFNCEHVANLATTGERKSRQLQHALTAAGLLATVALAVANENGTHVDDDGRRRDSSGRFARRRWV